MSDKIHGAATQSGPTVAPTLEITRGENSGETHQLKLKTRLGRERDNDVSLTDLKTSRYHAQISLEGDRWLLRDLGSANGTYLNERTVNAPTPLKNGDIIRLGETELLYKEAVRPDAKTAPTLPPAEPVPARRQPARTAAPEQGRPRLAWIAGGVILLVCLVAVFVVYLAASRTAGVTTAGETTPGPEQGTSAAAGTPAATQPANNTPAELILAYEDDFSDSFGGWDDAFDTYTRKVYGNNRYQIEVNASNLVAWGLANRNVADFEVEVEARQEDGDEQNSYGLIFRFQDRQNFYRFDVSGDGYYLVSKFTDGDWITLVDWTPSQFINTDGAANILKVSAFGPQLTTWVNGQQLVSVTDDSLDRGNFGFFAGTFAEPYTWVSFDNLKMWTPPDEEITLIPTATPLGAAAAAAAAEATPTPTITPTPLPTFTPTPTPAAEDAAESAAESPLPTPTSTAEPTTTPTATPTAPPLPSYASRDQALGRGEEVASGRIVFPIYDPERGTYDIYIANIADGSDLTLVQANASQPGLSPDGTEIAYRSWQPDKRGLFARPLAESDEVAWGFDLFFESARPQLSPVDRRPIYHSRTGGREPAIYHVVDGVGQVLRQQSFPVQGKAPKWGPQGQQIVYSSCLGSNCGVILSQADGTNPVQLTNHPSDTNPEISPNGTQVVFMSERGGNWEIYQIDIDGENLMALTSDSASDGLPTWSPEGDKIAFVSNRDGQWSVWDMDPDGSSKRRHFVVDGVIDGIVQHDIANSFGWVEENIDWIP